MSYRLVEVSVPGEDLSNLSELLTEQEVTDIWTKSGPYKDTARVLVPVGRTEGVTDLLQQRYGTSEGFRIMLLPVEAILPAPEEPTDNDARTQQAAVQQPPKPKTPERISREELYQDTIDRTRVTTSYLVMVALSTLVAAIGLVRGNMAVVIGAMVIAPLLGPNVGLALAATLGDLSLGLKSIRAILAGMLVSVGLSFLLGVALTVDPTVPEIAARTHAGIEDVFLGVAAGTAGALALTTGLPPALIGVMVAVALLPPLVAAAFLPDRVTRALP